MPSLSRPSGGLAAYWLSAVVVLSAAVFSLAGMLHQGSPLDDADIIYHNGDVITLEADGIVQAIAVKGDTIVAVGSNEDMLNLQGSTTTVVDLEGRTLLPGFVEGHSHMIGGNARGGLSLDEASDLAFSYGWTTLNELKMDAGERFVEFEQAEQSGQLRIRVNAFMEYNRARLEPDGSNEVVNAYWQIHPPVLDKGRFFRVIGIKIYLDGSLVNNPTRGCWGVTEPYATEFQESNYFANFCYGEAYGSIYMAQDTLNKVVAEAQQAGFQVAMHANGDSAIGMALDAIEYALDGASNEVYRHQIHHSSLLRPDQITSYDELDIIASIRGTYTTCRHENQPSVHGEERFEFVANKFSLPTLIEHTFAEGDFGWQYDPDTVSTRNNPFNPLINLWGFVTLKDMASDGSICDPPEWLARHEITIDQGLRLLTIGPAYAAGQEDVLGTLKAGKFADLVILDQNPLEVAPDEILGLSVLMTMVAGNVEFCREGSEALCTEAQATSIETIETTVPEDYSLKETYPNPFKASTTIAFDIMDSAGQSVKLDMFDTSGRRVRILVNELLSAGSYTVAWDGRDENGRPVSSGVYFYKLTAGSFTETKTTVLLR